MPHSRPAIDLQCEDEYWLRVAPDIFHKRFGGPCVYIIHIKLNYVNVYVLKIYGKSSSSEISYKHLHKIQFSYIISRTFALEQQVWPLVLNACSPCNNRGLKKWPSCSLGDWYHTRHLLEEVHWATEYSPMITAFKKKTQAASKCLNRHPRKLSSHLLKYYDSTFPGDKKNIKSQIPCQFSGEYLWISICLEWPSRLTSGASWLCCVLGSIHKSSHVSGFGETVVSFGICPNL